MLNKLIEIVKNSKVKIPILLFSASMLTSCGYRYTTRYATDAKVDNECESIEEAYQSKCSSFSGKPDYEKGHFVVTGQKTYRIPKPHLPPHRDTIIIIRERLPDPYYYNMPYFDD